MPKMTKENVNQDGKRHGFSLLELTVVVLLAMALTAFALPKMITAIRMFRLRGAGTDFSGMVQATRWRAVQDDRYYSVRFLTANGSVQAYVDIYPQNINGSSGNGAGGPADPSDPQIAVRTEVAPQAQANAPSTSNLKGQFLPSGSPVVPVDGSVSTSPISFGPRGLPCLPTSTNGGTVCNSAGGLQAYWVFFQDSITQDWDAVTVTPAGRIQVWYYQAGNWALIQQ